MTLDPSMLPHDPAAFLQPDEDPDAVTSPSGEELRPLDEHEVAGILEQEIQDAIGGIEGEIAEERRQSLSYYFARPFGNEQAGRSQVILEDVRDTIEWAMPHMMKMLAPSPQFFDYQPVGPEDTQQAQQASTYINHQFEHRLGGYEWLYEAVKTALIEKRGFGKVYVLERTEPKVETYHGIDDEQLEMLLSEEGVEPLERTDYEEMLGEQAPVMGPDGQPVVGPDGQPMMQPVPTSLHDVKVRVVRTEKQLCLDGIPPEEMLTARRMVKLDDRAMFVGQRKRMTVSDLIAEGVPADVALSLPDDDSPEYDTGRTERLYDEETYPDAGGERADPASRELWVTECHARIDEDGDGYSELRRILVAGESSITIIEDDEENWNPFFSICPIPTPHKFYGLSLADLVRDLQLIRSTILRQALDNLYLTNNSRNVVIEGQVNLDDLLVSRPGGLIRARSLDAVKPLEVQPVSRDAVVALEFLEGVKENRTGITRYNQGSDSGSLNKTATGVSRIMNAAYARLELIAQLFAKQLQRLGKLMLRAYVEGGFREDTIRLSGQWVTFDPRSWNAGMDVTVQIGMGVGQAAERLDALERMMGIQERILQSPFSYLVTPENVYNAASAMQRTLGFMRENEFVTNPEGREPPPPPPNPDLIKAETERETKTAQTQIAGAEQQRKALADQALADFRVQELQANTDVEFAKIESDERLKREEIAAKERMEKDKAKAQAEAAKAKAAESPSGGKKET